MALGHVIVLALIGLVLKGVVFPWLLLRTLRPAGVRREVEPFVGYGVSAFAGVLALSLSLGLAASLNSLTPAGIRTQLPLTLPASLFLTLIGLFLIVSRRKALTQVLGYLVLENGIYLFGLTLAGEVPLLVEMGVLLDVFVAVFVMGIAIFHISREFDHMDVEKLSVLKD